MVQGVFSGDVGQQYEATMRFRKLLSIGACCPSLSLSLSSCLSAPVAPPSVRSRSPPLHLCAERNPPIEEVIKTGVIPKFVEFLGTGETPQLQVSEAGWAVQLLEILLLLSSTVE